MAELPHPWDVYAFHQKALSNCRIADDTAWGLETCLNRLLDHDDTSMAPSGDDLDRIITSAARRSRYGRALVAKYVTNETVGTIDVVAHVEAVSDLRAIAKQLPAPSFQLLAALARGDGQAEIAIDLRIAPDALRARIARARAGARMALAA